MYKLTVLYGHPDDPEEFDRYYYETHIPIAKKMTGLVRWTVGKCAAREADQRPEYYFIANLYAESRAAMEAILDSPEGRAAADDVANFATGGAVFLFDDEEVIIGAGG